MADLNKNVNNIRRSVAGSSVNTFQNILNNLYKKLRLDEQAQKLNRQEIITKSIIAEASKNANLPVKAVPNQLYNRFMKECRARGIETSTLSLSNETKGYRYVIYHEADKEKLDLMIEKLHKTLEREVEIKKDDFYKFNLRRDAIKISDKDELWLERFKVYAAKEGLTYTKEPRADGKYDLHILASQIEKYNKASFQTEWDLNGRFAQVYKEKDIQAIIKREKYMERINKCAQRGAVIAFGKNRDDYSVIDHEKIMVYEARKLVKEIEVSDIAEYKDHIAKMLKHAEDITMLDMRAELRNLKTLEKELEKEDAKFAISIPANFETQLEADRAIKNIVMNGKDFSSKSSYTRDDIIKAKEDLISAQINAQNKIEVANKVIGEVNNKGHSIDFVGQANIAIGNLEKVSVECQKDIEMRDSYEIDETLIKAEDLERAREFAQEREQRAKLMDLDTELAKDDISLDERRELQREFDLTIDQINIESNIYDAVEAAIDLEGDIDEDLSLEEEIEIDLNSGFDDDMMDDF